MRIYMIIEKKRLTFGGADTLLSHYQLTDICGHCDREEEGRLACLRRFIEALIAAENLFTFIYPVYRYRGNFPDPQFSSLYISPSPPLYWLPTYTLPVS